MHQLRNGLLMLMAVFAVGSLSQCKTTTVIEKEQTLPEFTKRVKFKETKDDVYLHPSLTYMIDSVRMPRLVIRCPEVPQAMVKEDGPFNSNIYYELERSLVNNGFKVVDRTFFDIKTGESLDMDKFSDYLIEMVGHRSVKYYTGIVLHSRPIRKKGVRQPGMRHYYLGAEVSAKIIDLKTGEIVGIMRTNYTPCTKGCKVRYNEYQIIEESLDGEIEQSGEEGTMELTPVDVDMVRSMSAKIAKYLWHER